MTASVQSIARLLLAASLSLPLACAHAHDTEPPVETQGHTQPPTDRPASTAPRPPAPGEAPPHDRPGEGAAPVPVATSAAALLKPGAARQIQDKLADRGLLSGDHQADSLDGPTREALRKFQRDSDLPATGLPDDATVRKLGLEPDNVFKRSR